MNVAYLRFTIMSHQLHLCFLLAILLFFCPKTCRAVAIAYEEKDIDVKATWQQEKYNNDNTEKVTREITYTTGIKDTYEDSRMIEGTHNFKGDGNVKIKEIVGLEFTYTYQHKSQTVRMTADEIYTSRTIKTTVTIPPRSSLTRWELLVDVAGAKIAYTLNIDILNDNSSTPHTDMSRAKVLVNRRINYGLTRIRIKHFEKQQYITVISSTRNYPKATLGYSSRFIFILCQDSRGIRIKTLNTTYTDYVWAYSSFYPGVVYFDLNREPGYLHDGNVAVQHWSISKEEPLRDGDTVTFKNKLYTDGAISYYEGFSTNVYCQNGVEDKWVLEIADERDSQTSYC